MKAFTGGGALFSPAAKCQDAARKDIAYPELKSLSAPSLIFETSRFASSSEDLAESCAYATEHPGANANDKAKAVFVIFRIAANLFNPMLRVSNLRGPKLH